MKKKSLVGWIWKCEFNDVLKKSKGGDIFINEEVAPVAKERFLDLGKCGCIRGNHPKIKVSISIEQLPSARRKEKG